LLQCKASIDTLRDMQKGVKLHNVFIHWRHAGDEVWCGVFCFDIAPLDKWVVITSDSTIFSFSLAYYLIGAVVLDGVSQLVQLLVGRQIPQLIQSLKFLKDSASRMPRRNASSTGLP